VWTSKHWHYAAKADIPDDIFINNIDNLGHGILHWYEVSEAHETMGLLVAMGGDNKEERRYFQKNAKPFAGCVCTGVLSQEDAPYTSHRSIIKELKYPMVATTVDKVQWNYIMAPILLKVTLSCMGSVCTFPRDIVCTPKISLQTGHNASLGQPASEVNEGQACSALEGKW
jgi:hypothetical protein